MKVKKADNDVIIIGGGIMGLMCAYYASESSARITVIENKALGNKEAASFSFTRSIRCDYLEPEYARLAYEAQDLWREIESEAGEAVYINCGCLNLVKDSVSTNSGVTYAERSFKVSQEMHLPSQWLNKNELQKRFPQFNADAGMLDKTGGFLYLPAVTKFLIGKLKQRGVIILDREETLLISEADEIVQIKTDKQIISAKHVVITAGKGTNELLKTIEGNTLEFPLTYDRPQRKYFYPQQSQLKRYLPEVFPVFAYTDFGFYGHPIFDPQKGAVKIAYFVPVGMKQEAGGLDSIDAFVEACLPGLKDARSEEITDADKCWYDIVSDDQFILGRFPGYQRITIGTGWRGTGYKFSPIIGKVLAQLSLTGGTVFDIATFNPGRF